MNLLFVCSRNRLRSLTAERAFDGVAGHQVQSAGTEEDARVRVTADHVVWAELIFVMDDWHAESLEQSFPGAMAGKRVVCLHIPDDYGLMDERLIERLRSAVAPHVSFD
ncbi:MAG: protein tyrosine phosphatase [Byssovorax sp.]